ncbi:MAG TPA: hypothetical protein VD793_00370, partial [Gemmatimonadales bacterium]|nr:hypothetical protein [Gemmatimonadales bacterium]
MKAPGAVDQDAIQRQRTGSGEDKELGWIQTGPGVAGRTILRVRRVAVHALCFAFLQRSTAVTAVQRPGPQEFDPYYASYIDQVPDWADPILVMREQLAAVPRVFNGV